MTAENGRLESVSDIEQILRHPFKFSKASAELRESNDRLLKRKLLVLGGYTVDYISTWIYSFGVFRSLDIEVETSDWGAAFKAFHLAPNAQREIDSILCLNCSVDLDTGLRSKVSNDELLREISAGFESLVTWCSDVGVSICTTLFDSNWFVCHSSDYSSEKLKLISKLNAHILQLADECPGLTVINPHRALQFIPQTLFSSRDWYAYGQYYNHECSLLVAYDTVNILAGLVGQAKKAVVVDMDNTLYGGVIGDDGVEGIIIGDDSYESRIFVDLQRHLKFLKESGVFLCIASKNDEQIARQAFENPAMVLRWDDFSVIRSGWDRKSDSLVEIARALNVGIESLVFLDDNPVERFEVAQSLPAVCVPEIEDLPLDFLTYLRLADPTVMALPNTKEDMLRSESITANKSREQLGRRSMNDTEFLRALETRVRIFSAGRQHISRLSQLTNKTNQFNMTTTRLTDSDILQRISDPHSLVLAVEISDRFGSYGLTSILYLKKDSKQVCIENWVMSCRVFGKTAEYAVAESIFKDLTRKGYQSIKAIFIPSDKNVVVRDLFPRLGFSMLRTEGSSGGCEYYLSLTDGRHNISHECEVSYECHVDNPN